MSTLRGQGIDFRLLQGSEVEILADGTLGLPDEVLKTLDVAVASIHSAQRQDRETITARCLKAVYNPHVDILGHPTSRLLGSRPPTELDVERVLQACVETGTVVEINANPARLDLNDVYARRAVELGCKIAINCDAHAVDGMDIMEYGIAVARRAWLTAADVINTRPLPELLPMLKRNRARGAGGLHAYIWHDLGAAADLLWPGRGGAGLCAHLAGQRAGPAGHQYGRREHADANGAGFALRSGLPRRQMLRQLRRQLLGPMARRARPAARRRW